ncbi:hypothetical protein QE152_g23497 [Popillia japonica]|uniref:Uncharacterized protein n=1 Tax=Popillia japonica TaxID=7064 RepID=A0AAW1KHP4_POPJA
MRPLDREYSPASVKSFPRKPHEDYDGTDKISPEQFRSAKIGERLDRQRNVLIRDIPLRYASKQINFLRGTADSKKSIPGDDQRPIVKSQFPAMTIGGPSIALFSDDERSRIDCASR